jgi:hypothetical protein
LGTKENVQQVKMNSTLELVVIDQLIKLLKEFKYVFSWTYKDLKSIPPEIAQHWIELDTTIPPTHQARYQLNPNYVVIIKQDIDKLFVVSFIKLVEKTPWFVFDSGSS